MDELLKAIKSMPAPKKKIHTVTIQGKTIEVSIRGNSVRVRDFGRGIPLGKVFDSHSVLCKFL